MQISRHWRMQKQRYRLEGVRYEDGYMKIAGGDRYVQDISPDNTEPESEAVREFNNLVNQNVAHGAERRG